MTVLDDIISLRVSVCNVTSDHCPALLLSHCDSVTDITVTVSQCDSDHNTSQVDSLNVTLYHLAPDCVEGEGGGHSLSLWSDY